MRTIFAAFALLLVVGCGQKADPLEVDDAREVIVAVVDFSYVDMQWKSSWGRYDFDRERAELQIVRDKLILWDTRFPEQELLQRYYDTKQELNETIESLDARSEELGSRQRVRYDSVGGDLYQAVSHANEDLASKGRQEVKNWEDAMSLMERYKAYYDEAEGELRRLKPGLNFGGKDITEQDIADFKAILTLHKRYVDIASRLFEILSEMDQAQGNDE